MDKIKEIIRKKPALFLVVSLCYALGVGFIKWGIPLMKFIPSGTEGLRINVWLPQAALYLIGAIIGVYFLDGAEVFFNLKPSPFRSVVFVAAFTAVSFFMVTSSGSFVGSGLVLSLYLSLILWQVGELEVAGNLNSWYRLVAGPVSVNVQRWVLFVFIAFFVLETFLFIR